MASDSTTDGGSRSDRASSRSGAAMSYATGSHSSTG